MSLLAPLLTLSVMSATDVAPGTQRSQVATVELSARADSSSAVDVSAGPTEAPPQSPPQSPPVDDAAANSGQPAPADLALVLDPYGLRPSHRANAGKGLTISSYVFGGIGTGLMLVGVTYLGLSMKQRDKVSSDALDTLEERRELLQQIEQHDRNMTIFMSAGAGTLVLATMLYLAGRRQRARATSTATANMRMRSWTRGDGFGLTLRGVF